MTETLDRINATLDRVATQQEKNTQGIDDLLGAIATTDRQVQNVGTKVDTLVQKMDSTNQRVDTLVQKMNESNQRFETLRAEAQADRKETRKLWNDAVTQMERDRAEANRKHDEAIAQMETNRAEASRRFEAQQEAIQRLLVELVDMNRDNRRLRDRVDQLEAG